MARRVGLRDQSLALRLMEPGKLAVRATWDRIPHVFSTNGRSMGTLVGEDNFTLPSPRPDTSTWNALAPNLPPIRTTWDAARVSATYMPTPSWDLKAEVTNIDKKGQRPMGMAFSSPGGNTREILEPIDQVQRAIRLMPAYAGEKFQLTAGLDFSSFDNAFASVTADNPLRDTDGAPNAGGARGRTALAPSNSAVTGVVNGAASLPLHTRIHASASHATWKQDEDFIPATINTAITDPRIAEIPRSLGGKAGTSQWMLSGVSRPLTQLSVTVRLRKFDYRDKTELEDVPVLIVNDRSISAGEEREQFPYSRTNADYATSWRFDQLPITVGVGYAREQFVRDGEHNNVHRLTDNARRAFLDYAPSDWMSLRTSYATSERRARDPYVQHEAAELPEFRRFFQTDRDRHRTIVKLTLTPLDQLTVAGNWELGTDDYPGSAYGTQRDHSTMAGGDVIWTPTDRVSFDAAYTYETFGLRQRSRYRAPGITDNLTYDWVSNTRDKIRTTDVGFSAVLVPDRWEAGGRLDISDARYVMATYNPLTPTGGTAAQNLAATAVDLPEVTQKLQPMMLWVSYRYSADWAATLRYQSERYNQNDFRTLGLRLEEGGGIFLGNNYNNYNARYLTFTVTYRPAFLRAGRSAL